MADISVIVPVYNGSAYLKRCVDSLIAQTKKNIEIILVDDGSTDESNKICDRYAQLDKRIISVHKKNGGLGSARNYGIQLATSEYIGFVDCDDWVNTDTYQYLYDIAVRYKADISSGKFLRVHFYKQYSLSQKSDIKVYKGINKLKTYLEIGINSRSSQYSACTKLYRKSLFDTIKFPENQLYEDVVTNYKLLDKANAFVLSNKYVYNYYMGSTSITRSKCSKKSLDLVKVGNQIKQLTLGTEIEKLGQLMCAQTYFSLMVRAELFGFDDSILKPKDITNMLNQHIAEYFSLLIFSNLAFSRKVLLALIRYCPNLTHVLLKLVRGLVKFKNFVTRVGRIGDNVSAQ